jgi:hypothetical protein
MKKIFLLLISILFSACASHRDASKHGYNAWGGGYQTTKLGADLYLITANSNMSPFINYSSAHKSIKKQATILCGEKPFELHNVHEKNFQSIPPFGEIPYITSQVTANIYCAEEGSDTFSVAMKKISAQNKADIENRKISILVNEKIISDCLDTKPVDTVKIASEIANLKAAGRYQEAIACHNKIISQSQDKELITQSLLDMSLMYELGLGVDINLQKAEEYSDLANQQ